jgi:lysophospholipase L1-like esterase
MQVLPSVICIGDSLTEFGTQPGGWAVQLQNYFVSRRDVLVRGCSGYNSRWLKQLLPQMIPQCPHGEVAVVMMLVGTNDSVEPRAASGPGWPQQHVPVAEYEQNLSAMVEHLVGVRNSDGGSPIVVVASPPPTDGDAWHRFMLKMRGLTDAAASSDDLHQRSCAAVKPYADAARRVVEARQVQLASGGARLVFIDLYQDMLADEGSGGWRRFLGDDGLHFSNDGNQFVFDRIRQALTAAEGPADALPRHAPHFFEVINVFGAETGPN